MVQGDAPGTSLPAPWQFTDVGDVIPGNANFSNDIFTIQGTSGEIFEPDDKFHFVFQSFSGDVELMRIA